MKRKYLLLALAIVLSFSQLGLAKASYSESDILGVWKLTKFFITDGHGLEKEWCEGANGSIAYLPGLMTVAINCESVEPGSGAEKIGGLLFYSGPFEVDRGTNEVIHRVRNFSHPALNKVYRREIEMKDKNNLRLVGSLGEGKKAIVEWERMETFSYDSQKLTGVWELVGSENKVDGSDETISFCTGFYGTILYTSGGYNAVSINCGEKPDNSVSEPADQFGRRFFYSGSYKIDGENVVQTPENASETALIGEPAIRSMKIEGDLLILEGTNGSKFKAEWKKLRSFVGLQK